MNPFQLSTLNKVLALPVADPLLELFVEPEHVRRWMYVFFYHSAIAAGESAWMEIDAIGLPRITLPVWGSKTIAGRNELGGFGMNNDAANARSNNSLTYYFNPDLLGGGAYPVQPMELPTLQATRITLKTNAGAGTCCALLGCLSLP